MMACHIGRFLRGGPQHFRPARRNRDCRSLVQAAAGNSADIGRWKIARDTKKRGYDREQVEAEMDKREPESAEFIHPQRTFADIVVRFAPIPGRDDPPETPLSAELLLRPTVRHPTCPRYSSRWTVERCT